MAQFGRALRSGRRGRGFESRHFDYLAGAPKALRNQGFRCFFMPKKGSVRNNGSRIQSRILRIFYECILFSKKIGRFQSPVRVFSKKISGKSFLTLCLLAV